MISSIPDSSTIIVFKLDSMNYIDQSGIYIFEEIITSLTDSNKQIYYTGLQNQPKLMLKQMGLFDSKINDDKVYIDYTKCINEIKKNL